MPLPIRHSSESWNLFSWLSMIRASEKEVAFQLLLE